MSPEVEKALMNYRAALIESRNAFFTHLTLLSNDAGDAALGKSKERRTAAQFALDRARAALHLELVK